MISEKLPDADIAIDPFGVVRLAGPAMNQVCCDEWNAHERSYSNVRRWLKARLGHEGGSLSERDRRSFLIFLCGPTCSCTFAGQHVRVHALEWTERPVVGPNVRWCGGSGLSQAPTR